MTDSFNGNNMGTATITPAEPVVAGSMGTWRLTLQAGARGIAAGGGVRVGTDSDTDWAIPQFIDPTAADYMTAEAPAGVRVNLQTLSVKTVQAILRGNGLQPGESVTLIYGDRSGGGPGSRAQTFFEPRRYFRVSVDVDGSGQWTPLDEPPHVAIVGDDAVRLVVNAPSMRNVNEEFSLIIKAEDRWGNPVDSFRGTVSIHCDGLTVGDLTVSFPENHNGVQNVTGLRIVTAGVYTITCVDTETGLTGESNPMVVGETPDELRLQWADSHGGQVILNSKFADFFRYARDVSGIQFVGFQRNADVISQEDWKVQQQVECELHEPGRFIPIPGFEWSGKTWHGGHHNVYFRRHNQPVHRNEPIERPDSVQRETELRHIEDVYAHYRNTDTIITMHVGGEHSNLEWHDPSLETSVELASTHGSFEWMLEDSIERGYKLGVQGGSDCYTGRPGDDRPGYQLRRYARSGLTGIYTEDITLPAFFEAMRARRTFATTGEKMVLRVDADGRLMGSEYITADSPTINVSVVGTAPLESVELFRGLEKIHTWQPQTAAQPNRIRILWRGASRMTSYSGIVWDGNLNVTSGTIKKVEPLRFDSPRSHFSQQNTESLNWHAWGCGYPMGLLVDLDGDNKTRLDISVATQTITAPAHGRHGSYGPRRISFAPAEAGSFNCGLSDLSIAGEELDLGILERKLTVSRVKEPGPRSVEFQYTDSDPKPGINPYWVRVVQADMNMGWTSPVFVDFVGRLASD